jgi:uncharacterized membrane protein YjjP (DUF1212 family)
MTMTLEERADLVLAFAQVLHVNGQATDQTLAAIAKLSGALGIRAQLFVQWGELQLHAREKDANLIRSAAASPTGVDMDRVVSTMRAIDALCAGELTAAAASQTIHKFAQAPPAPTWLFSLAAGAGAGALSVLFGVQHLSAAVLIFISAAVGAVLRRTLARYSANALLQPFSAALLAGVIGALAVRAQMSSSLRLVSLCPCMVLVPGPHVLNSALDLIAARVNLGAARLTYAALVVVAISAGLLLGQAGLGVPLPVNESGASVSLWEDVIAAGVAVAAYSIFFSTPLYMLPWPIAVGMFAHALRWSALMFGASAATGALIACVIVGLILTLVSRRWHMPFAAIGFASVVSMIPGVFLFKMSSGFLQLATDPHPTPELVSGTIVDGITAVIIISAMSFGLIVPKLIIDWLGARATEHKA